MVGSYGTAPVSPDRQPSPWRTSKIHRIRKVSLTKFERHRSDPLCEPHVKTRAFAAFDWSGHWAMVDLVPHRWQPRRVAHCTTRNTTTSVKAAPSIWYA